MQGPGPLDQAYSEMYRRFGDEGWGERDSNEELRHHSLLPGLFKGLSSGVRTGGWAGQRRKKEGEDDRGGGTDVADGAQDSVNGSLA